MWANHDHSTETMNTPEHTLWLQIEKLHAARNQQFPVHRFCKRVDDFLELTKSQLSLASQSRRISKNVFCAEDIAATIVESCHEGDGSPDRKSVGELEILAREEKTPELEKNALATMLDSPVTDDPYKLWDDDGEVNESTWALFDAPLASHEQISPNMTAEHTAPSDASNSHQLWQTSGAIVGFQRSSSPSYDSCTATWKDPAPAQVTPMSEPKPASLDPSSGPPLTSPSIGTIFLTRSHSDAFVPIRFAEHATVGDIITADNAIVGHAHFTYAVNIMGIRYHESQLLHDDMWIHLCQRGDDCCSENGQMSRLQHLFQQGAWVATDELAFYMSDHPFHDQMYFHGTLGFETCTAFNVVLEQMSQQLSDMIAHVQNQRTQSFAMIHDHHWIPWVVDQHDDQIRIHTTPQGAALVARLQSDDYFNILGDFVLVQHDLPLVFDGDCGFQCKIWR